MSVKDVVGKLGKENISKKSLMQLAKGDEKKLFAEESSNVSK